MTGEEKINKDIASRSREEKVQEINEQVAEWDFEAVVDYAQYRIEEDMKSLSDSDFDEEYYEFFAGRYEDGDWEDDEVVGAIFAEVVDESCGRCGKNKDAGKPCWWCGG